MDGRSRRICTGDIAIELSLAPLRAGPSDPSFLFSGDTIWWSTHTFDGPATLRFRASNGTTIVTAWGPGAEAGLEGAPAALGVHDDRHEIPGATGALRAAYRRLPGLRLGRSHSLVEHLVRTVIEQRVTSGQAHRSYRALVRRFGSRAPGPAPLMLPPPPEALSSLPLHEYHQHGIERRRATTVKRVCTLAPQINRCSQLAFDEARARLRTIPGLGAWTVETAVRSVLGDPDAVVVGDFHLPNLVAWFLAGEVRADDRRMLELLEPFRGQRGRVMRLIELSGSRPPKLGPRRRVLEIQHL